MKKKCFWLSLLCAGCALGADKVWPNWDFGTTGDLSSNGADGWNGNMPAETGDTLWFYGGGTYSPYLKDGKTATFLGTTRLRNMASKDEAHVTLEVSGGARLNLGALYFGDSPNEDMNGSMALKIGDGATVDVATKLVTMSGNNAIEVSGGGTLSTTNATEWNRISYYEGNPATTVSTNRFCFNGGTWHMGKMLFGNRQNSATSDIVMGATNSVFTAKELAFATRGSFDLNGTTWTVQKDTGVGINDGMRFRMDGGKIEGGKWHAGNDGTGYTTEFTFCGGADAALFGFSMAKNAGTEVRATVRGAGTRLTMGGGFDYDASKIADAGTAVLTIEDGGHFGTREDFPAYQPVRLGVSAGGNGTVELKGGSVEVLGYGFWVGCKGSGTFRMEGGEARFKRVMVGQDTAGAGCASRCEVSGGHMLVGGGTGTTVSDDSGMLCLGWGNHPASLVLKGGVLETGKVSSKYPEKAYLLGDGGTLRKADLNFAGNDPDKKFVSGIGRIECGVGGLVVDTNGRDEEMSGDVANAEGVQGRFVKAGEGTLTYSGNITVAETEVRKGTLKVPDGATVPKLTVAGGARFSLEGDPATVELGSLSMDGGIIRLDLGDVVKVGGLVAVSRAGFEFTSVPAVGAEAPVMELPLDVGESARAEIREGIVKSLLGKTAVGTHPEATFAEADGVLKVGVKVAADAELSAETVWTGASGGSWSDAGNWSAGRPDGGVRAEFGALGGEVTVAGETEVGALAFASGETTITGGKLVMPAELGSVKITAAEGASGTVESAIEPALPVTVDVAAGATVRLGDVIGGGMVKLGGGTLELNGETGFRYPLSVTEGKVRMASPAASGAGPVEIAHGGGMIEFASAGAEYRYGLAGKNGEAATVKADEDVMLADVALSSGRLVKRGAAKATMRLRSGSWGLVEDREIVNNKQLVFADDGAMPTYADGTECATMPGLVVAEGAMRLEPADAENRKVTIGNAIQVGAWTAQGSEDARLELKDIDMESRNCLYVGWGQAGGTGCFSVNPKMVAEGCSLRFDTVTVGRFCYGSMSRPEMHLTNTTLTAAWGIQLSQGNNGECKSLARWTGKDSELVAGSGNFQWYAGLDADFDNCRFGGANGTCTKLTDGTQWSHGTMAMRNGTVFAVDGLRLSAATHDIALKFDGAVWQAGSGAWTLDGTMANLEKFRIVLEGEGVRFDVGEGGNVGMLARMEGAGNLVKSGAGTLRFGPGAYCATGTLFAEEGAVDFAEAGAFSGVKLGGDAGTFKNGTFSNAAITIGEGNGGLLGFENCAFAGRTAVTIEGEAHTSAERVVARAAGEVTGLETFRLRGWPFFAAKFSRKGDAIVATITRGGFTVILR